MSDKKPILPLLVIFVILNGFFLTAGTLFEKYAINRDVVIIANVLFFLISLVSFFMQRKGLKTKNPHAFVRGVMGSMLVRMAIAVAAVVFYLMMAGNEVNKPAVFISIFLYILYLVIEVAIVMKLNRRPNA